MGNYFHYFMLSDPVSRNLVNGSATLEEGAARNELPGQDKYTFQFLVFGSIVLVMIISLIFIFVFVEVLF